MRTRSLHHGLFLLLASTALLALSASTHAPSVFGQPETSAGSETTPVEDDMHEFMEYVFQPPYQRLKANMAAQPSDNNAWKAIKSDSLILAEGGNLLLMRKSEEDAKSWSTLSTQVRDHGAQLYQAAKKKDYKAARQHYETMLTKCNACHEQFAGGEYQLEP